MSKHSSGTKPKRNWAEIVGILVVFAIILVAVGSFEYSSGYSHGAKAQENQQSNQQVQSASSSSQKDDTPEKLASVSIDKIEKGTSRDGKSILRVGYTFSNDASDDPLDFQNETYIIAYQNGVEVSHNVSDSTKLDGYPDNIATHVQKGSSAKLTSYIELKDNSDVQINVYEKSHNGHGYQPSSDVKLAEGTYSVA